MFRLKPITSFHFDIFRTQFGIYSAILVGLLLGDYSLGPVFGNWIYLSSIIGVISALSWSLNIHRKLAALVYLFCLATIVEGNPSALRIIPGYVGWIFFISLFIASSEGCFLRSKPADSSWQINSEIHATLIITLAFSFTFSGITKLFSSLWLNGNAIDAFFFNARFNWDLIGNSLITHFTKVFMNYFTLIIELLFFPLYLIPKLRSYAWYLLFILFVGMLVFMRIYIVSLGILSTLVLLYQPIFLNKKPGDSIL
ncbi:MAG: hypothetical protein WA160_05495 [Pseudobdellovibrio sp.]